MTNDLTLESARNLTDAQLMQALLYALEDAAQGIRRGCIAVATLRERGIQLPVLPEVFRYAQEVADGALSAQAAMTLARYPFAVKAVLGMDHELQDQLADGQKVKIAIKVGGRIQSAERTIWEMSQMQMRVAFADGKITPWEEQGEWLLKAGYAEPDTGKAKALPRFREKDGRIVVGRAQYSVDDFMQAFAAAGFQIVPIYKGKRITQPKAVTRN